MLPDRFEAACRRFKEFFDELAGVFVEREDVLTQIALALLTREHVLMTGPPGTAKSNIASAVLRRVIDEETGEPSLFSRQFTESTVQTDLVGPINFKTLMESGRTEHFTDEGMLGAVHAFLDEVFDGRDMLLRSTLNVLQERELKQGAKVTRGRIECALMTSNRYLAEILTSSRETLLAFVDRIAFVSFVPRGFAGKGSMTRVLEAQLGTRSVAGTGPLWGVNLRATLTIQDLDALQAATDSVWISRGACASLVKLIELYDEEAASAERADPTFVATRYLSTRAIVRLGRVLRGVAVYDRIFRDPEHPLEVVHEDLAGARFGLLLCGPRPDAIKELLAKETDPRERRQLAIVRTEREIFDRVISKVPTMRRSTPPPLPRQIEAARAVAESPESRETKDLVEVTKELAVAADARDRGAEEAARLLERTVRELHERALKRGLGAGLVGEEVDRVALELAELAEEIERSSGQARPMARWLRGRAASMVDEAARMLVPGVGESIKKLDSKIGGLGDVRAPVEKTVSELEKLARMRQGLRAAGAEIADPAASDRAFTGALASAEADVAAMLDAGFRAEVQGVMTISSDLGVVLQALAEPFSAIAAVSARLGALGFTPKLESLVIGPRIKPLVSAAFARIHAVDEKQLRDDVQSLLDKLRAAGLGHVLAPRDLLSFTAAALVRTKAHRPDVRGAPHDRGTYRKLRQDSKVPAAYTLLDLALALAPAAPGTAQGMMEHVQKLAQGLEGELAERIARLDLARLEDTVQFFERWWTELEEQDLDAIARSGYFQIVSEERALFRFVLETRLVSEVFPSAAEEAAALRARIDALAARSDEHVRQLLRKRSDHAWAEMLRGVSA